jgi:hypothetical protein
MTQVRETQTETWNPQVSFNYNTSQYNTECHMVGSNQPIYLVSELLTIRGIPA